MTSRGVSSAGANARASGSVHRLDRSVIDTTGRPPSYRDSAAAAACVVNSKRIAHRVRQETASPRSFFSRDFVMAGGLMSYRPDTCEAKLDGVVAHHKNDRDSRSRRLGRQCRVEGVRDDYADMMASQIGRAFSVAAGLPLRR